MEKLVSLESFDEDFNEEVKIEYDVVIDDKIKSDSYSMPSVENEFIYTQLNRIDEKIDFLTCDADKLDYLISAASGILCAGIDSVLKEVRINKTFVKSADGKDLLDFFNESGANLVNEKVEKIAKDSKTAKKAEKSIKKGNTLLTEKAAETEMESEKLSGMVRYLENRFNLASDSFEQYFGGTTKHHLNDFAHHPSIVGFIFSLLTQFTYKCYGTDDKGAFKVLNIRQNLDDGGRIAKIKDGKNVYIKIIGQTFSEKITFATTIWYYHLISDLAGSSGTLSGYEKRNMSTLGKGAGVPGPLMSLAKTLSVLPIFNKINDNGENENKFAEFIDKLYSGDVFKKIDENGKEIKRKIDYRTEAGIKKELKEESKMVLLNEMIVRSFYFFRNLGAQIKENNIKRFNDLHKIDTAKIIPFGNRTIVRMMTISTGSFTATNLAVNAAVSAVKSGGEPVTFARNFVLRINFVGIGRFFVAVSADITEEAVKRKLINDSSALAAQQAILSDRVDMQTTEIMNDFANRLSGKTEQSIIENLSYLGENDEE